MMDGGAKLVDERRLLLLKPVDCIEQLQLDLGPLVGTLSELSTEALRLLLDLAGAGGREGGAILLVGRSALNRNGGGHHGR